MRRVLRAAAAVAVGIVAVVAVVVKAPVVAVVATAVLVAMAICAIVCALRNRSDTDDEDDDEDADEYEPYEEDEDEPEEDDIESYGRCYCYDLSVDPSEDALCSVCAMGEDGDEDEEPQLSQMMENIARDTTLPVETPERRQAMVVMGQVLLDEGYEPAFVAGMLGNIMREGSFGQFEFANRNPAPCHYTYYFVMNHDYFNRFSGRIITNVDATTQEIYDMISGSPSHEGSPNVDNIFGLGLIQWTNRPRILPLVRYYVAVSEGGRITMDQVVEAETRMLVSELRSGEHTGGGGIPWDNSYLPDVWRERNAGNLNSSEAARSAAEMITRSLLRPGYTDIRATERGNYAAAIFEVMMQQIINEGD